MDNLGAAEIMKQYRLWEIIYTVRNDYRAANYGAWYLRLRAPWGALTIVHGWPAVDRPQYVSAISLEWGERMMYIAEAFIWFRDSWKLVFDSLTVVA